jgi:hypothetical protein
MYIFFLWASAVISTVYHTLGSPSPMGIVLTQAIRFFVNRGDSRKLPGRVAETPHQPRLDGIRHPSRGERRLGQGGGRELP